MNDYRAVNRETRRLIDELVAREFAGHRIVESTRDAPITAPGDPCVPRDTGISRSPALDALQSHARRLGFGNHAPPEKAGPADDDLVQVKIANDSTGEVLDLLISLPDQAVIAIQA